jgi:hypothetical protein
MSLTSEKKPEIIALLLEGKTIGQVNKATGVSKSAIWRIKEGIKEGKYHQAVRDVEENIGEYIAESLLTHLNAMNNIARIASEEGYIRSQNSRDVAELHRTLENWSISILQASNNIQNTSRMEEQQNKHSQFQYLEIESTDK